MWGLLCFGTCGTSHLKALLCFSSVCTEYTACANAAVFACKPDCLRSRQTRPSQCLYSRLWCSCTRVQNALQAKHCYLVAKEDIGAVSGLNSSYVHGILQQTAGSSLLWRTPVHPEGMSFRPEAVGVAVWAGYTSGTLTLHIHKEQMLRVSWWAASWTYRKVL